MDSIDEIRNLIYHYYHLMDLGITGASLPCTARTESSATGTRGPRGRGRTRPSLCGTVSSGCMTAFLARSTASRTVVDRVRDDDAHATAKCYTIEFQATDGLPLQPLIVGRWYDDLAKVDGTWRFVERRWFSDLVGDLSAHLKPEALGWWEEGAQASTRAYSARPRSCRTLRRRS